MVRDWIKNIRENIGYLTLACAVAEVAVGYVLNHGRSEIPGPDLPALPLTSDRRQPIPVLADAVLDANG
jgi:hypothetical protein